MVADLETIAADLEARAKRLRMIARQLRENDVRGEIGSIPTFSELLRQKMEDLGLSQTGVARLIPVSQPYVSQLLRGKRIPTEATAQHLARKIGLSMEEQILFGLAAQKSRSTKPTR